MSEVRDPGDESGVPNGTEPATTAGVDDQTTTAAEDDVAPDSGVQQRAEADEDPSGGDASESAENAADAENPLEAEAEIAADYLEELLDIADLDGDIDTYIEGDRAHVAIVSDSKVLVGRDGAVLDALQELTQRGRDDRGPGTGVG